MIKEGWGKAVLEESDVGRAKCEGEWMVEVEKRSGLSVAFFSAGCRSFSALGEPLS